MKMVNGTETVTTNITVNVGTGLDENTAINNALNIGFDGAKRGIVAFGTIIHSIFGLILIR